MDFSITLCPYICRRWLGGLIRANSFNTIKFWSNNHDLPSGTLLLSSSFKNSISRRFFCNSLKNCSFSEFSQLYHQHSECLFIDLFFCNNLTHQATLLLRIEIYNILIWNHDAPLLFRQWQFFRHRLQFIGHIPLLLSFFRFSNTDGDSPSP